MAQFEQLQIRYIALLDEVDKFKKDPNHTLDTSLLMSSEEPQAVKRSFVSYYQNAKSSPYHTNRMITYGGHVQQLAQTTITRYRTNTD